MADLTVDERILKQTATQLLSTNLVLTTAFNFDWEPYQVLVALSASRNVTVEVFYDSADGVNYDTLISSISANAQYFAFSRSDFDILLPAGNELRVVVSLVSGGSATAYATVIGAQR